MADTWSLVESPFRIATAKAYEGLFTQGSGYLHVRGSLEEHLEGAPQNTAYTRMPASVTSEKFREVKVQWGTYVPGLFGRHPLLNHEMINLPFFLDLVPVVGGEKLDMELSRIRDYRRELLLRTAVLRRTLVWQTRQGAEVQVTFERFASAARPSLFVQRMTLSADRSVTVALRAGIDGDVRTNGYDHFTAIAVDRDGPRGVACRLTTDAGDDVRLATRLRVPADSWAYDGRARGGWITGRLALAAGLPVTVEKLTAVATSRDVAPAEPAAALQAVADRSYESLEAEHAAVWTERWARSDVVVEGDDRSQLALRASVYHLLRSHVAGDPRVAIDAKGYAGEAYWGRFFWDTEMYLLPFFLYTDPPRARTLVDFRVQSLPGAMANAAEYGYAGARYAWESDSRGRECCPNWPYRDHEVHVTADVVYAMLHYARAAEADYLAGPAGQVLLETARYWMQRMDWRPGEGRPSLLGVMGPDEYTPISNNNAYTNRMVSLALAAAAAHPAAPPDEAKSFAAAAAGLPVLRGLDGVLVLQCEDFDRLAEPRFDCLWRDRTRPLASQVSQERLYRSKCLKQADVLMMMLQFAGEFSDAEVRRAWDYYLPYTTHDSSLSAGIHAILAARLGLAEEAWRFWRQSAEIDLDVAHGGAAEGVHIAGAGANWQVAVLGFAGMATAMQSDGLHLDPRPPQAWSRLAFPIVWKGCPAYVDITPDKTTVANRGAQALRVDVGGERREISAGATATFPALQRRRAGGGV